MSTEQQLKNYLDETGRSQAKVSRAIGVSQTAFNQWLNGKYPGDVKALEKKLQVYMNRESARMKQPKIAPFVETDVSRDIHAGMYYCHINGIMGMIWGPSGYGKTTAVKEYARKNPDTINLIAPYGCSKWTIQGMVANELGLPSKGSFVFNGIVEALEGTERMIVMDEAQFMAISALETIRQIHDFAGTPIVMVAMPEIRKKMLGKFRDKYEQIYSRMLYRLPLEPPTYHDVAAILKANGIDDERAAEYLFKRSKHGGSLRTVTGILQMAMRRSMSLDKPLDFAIIMEEGRNSY